MTYSRSRREMFLSIMRKGIWRTVTRSCILCGRSQVIKERGDIAVAFVELIRQGSFFTSRKLATRVVFPDPPEPMTHVTGTERRRSLLGPTFLMLQDTGEYGDLNKLPELLRNLQFPS